LGYDKVSKVEVRKKTGMAKLEETFKEKKTRMARARDKDEGLQNTEPSFKLEPQQHEQETRKAPEKLVGRDLKDIE